MLSYHTSANLYVLSLSGDDIAKTIGQDKPPDALDQALG